jgi:hypothetical protein
VVMAPNHVDSFTSPPMPPPGSDSLPAASDLDWSVSKVKVMLCPMVIQPVCLRAKPHVGLKTTILLLSDTCRFVDMGHSL